VSVGEVFEVMTHVDHVLTLVNKFDRQLRLIKNLGVTASRSFLLKDALQTDPLFHVSAPVFIRNST
jgi:hypothetical protein